jgi:hypothetical protein
LSGRWATRGALCYRKTSPCEALLMSATTCMKCGGTHFELAKFTPTGTRFVLWSAQCAGCGTSIGITEYNDTASMLNSLEKRQEERLGAIEAKLNALIRVMA